MNKLAQTEEVIEKNLSFLDCGITLRKLMSREQINATELARRIDLPQPTIHRLLAGKTDDPKISTLHVIAQYFRITIDQLLGNTPLEGINNFKKSLHSFAIPVISWSDAINSEKFIGNLTEDSWQDWFVIDLEASTLTFGLRSKRSMEPRFPTGSFLAVDPHAKLQDGDLVIVYYENTDEATIREVLLDGPKQQLLSIQDSSISDELTTNIKVLGVVIQTKFSYK